jgi:hypothetical protein
VRLLGAVVHDGGVTKKYGYVVAGLMLVVAGAALWFAAVRLDVADQWGSVAGGTAAVLGLPLTIYGIVLARRGGAAGGVQQRIQPGRDAYVAGRDQYFDRRD